MRKQWFKSVSVFLAVFLIIQILFLPYGKLFLNDSQVFGQDLAVNVNFQPKTASVPTGFIADHGKVYGSHNGYIYGWNTDHSDLTVSEDVYHSTTHEYIHSVSFQWHLGDGYSEWKL